MHQVTGDADSTCAGGKAKTNQRCRGAAHPQQLRGRHGELRAGPPVREGVGVRSEPVQERVSCEQVVPPEGSARGAEARDVVPGQARDDEGEEFRVEVEDGEPTPRLGRAGGKLQ